MTTVQGYDPLSPESKVAQQDLFAVLRAGCPVHYHSVPPAVVEKQTSNYMVAGPTTEFWSVFRYDDAVRVLQDRDNFSAKEGPGSERMAPITEDGMLLFADDPAHARQRKIVNKAFLPRTVETLRPTICASIDDLIDSVAARGECDLMNEVSLPLTVAMITELFGAGKDRREDITRWGIALFEGFGGSPEAIEASAIAMQELFGCVLDAIDERRALLEADKPIPDDVLSALITAEHDGSRFSDEEILNAAFQFLTAGYETTATAIGNAIKILSDHPAERARLEADWSLLDVAIEEILRYESPVEGLFRSTKCPVRLGDVDLPAGAKVRIVYASANRDDSRFDDAQTFRLDRPVADLRGHIAFGTGPHACIGSALARRQLSITLETILRRLPGIEVDASKEAVRATALIINGYKVLPVRWDATRAQPRLWD